MDEVVCHACGKPFDDTPTEKIKMFQNKAWHLKCLRKVRRIAKKKYVYGSTAGINAALEDYRRKVDYAKPSRSS